LDHECQGHGGRGVHDREEGVSEELAILRPDEKLMSDASAVISASYTLSEVRESKPERKNLLRMLHLRLVVQEWRNHYVDHIYF